MAVHGVSNNRINITHRRIVLQYHSKLDSRVNTRPGISRPHGVDIPQAPQEWENWSLYGWSRKATLQLAGSRYPPTRPFDWQSLSIDCRYPPQLIPLSSSAPGKPQTSILQVPSVTMLVQYEPTLLYWWHGPLSFFRAATQSSTLGLPSVVWQTGLVWSGPSQAGRTGAVGESNPVNIMEMMEGLTPLIQRCALHSECEEEGCVDGIDGGGLEHYGSLRWCVR